MTASLSAAPARRLNRDTLGHGSNRLLLILLILLFAIPSRLIFAPAGGAGTPADLFGIALLACWVFGRLANPGLRTRVPRPIHLAMVLFALAVAVSYLIGMANPIDPTVTSSADRGLLNVLSWMGMTYAVADGPRTREEFLTLLHRITIGAGLLALLGILQFLTKQAFTNYIEIPGLSTNTELSSVIDRNGFARPAGTAIHPIEFGAVLTMALPIALHLAMWDKERRALVRWFPVVAIAIAVPISISRSAILSGAIALIVVMSGWPKTTRRKAYLAIVGLVTFLFLTVHGLLGTISGLFTGLSSDSSASSRTGSYGLALDFIKRSPYFGRGFHTFSPSYHIFDNQYLGLLVELGVIGTGTVIVIFASAIRAAWIVRRRSTDPETRSLAQALAASVLSTGLSIALYDAFGFGMATGLMFVVIGCCGCLWRLYSPQSAQPDANAESPSRTTPADVRSQHAAQRARVLSRAARP